MTRNHGSVESPDGPGGADGKPLSAAGFARAAGVSRETLQRLESYVALLDKWNRRINLVSRAGMADVSDKPSIDRKTMFSFSFFT